MFPFPNGNTPEEYFISIHPKKDMKEDTLISVHPKRDMKEDTLISVHPKRDMKETFYSLGSRSRRIKPSFAFPFRAMPMRV